MKLRGILFIILASVIPLLWTVPLMAQHNSAGVISQYFGIVALILMGITQFVATRVKGVEAIFGSLDRVYVLHKWLGIGALGLSFLHAEIDAEAGNIALIRSLSDAAEGIGELSYNGLIILTLASVMTFIPYKLWKWSHRFIGLFFALAAFHYIYIEKPYAVFDMPGLYTTAFCLLGIASYLYLLIPRMFGHNSKSYKVTEVVQHGPVTEITMKPEGRGIEHKAGQFAFVNFAQLNLRETHPYTISSAPRPDGSLRFLVKGLGSYTKRLGTALNVGDDARVSGPHGHFSLEDTKSPQVWIGGGIGITPFMAWAQALPDDWATPTHLYYCVRDASDAVNYEELREAANRVDNLHVTLVTSSSGKRLSAEQIAAELGQDVRTAHAYFCGPEKMRNALNQGLVGRGLPLSNFHYEEFEMRSGVGPGGVFRSVANLFSSASWQVSGAQEVQA